MFQCGGRSDRRVFDAEQLIWSGVDVCAWLYRNPGAGFHGIQQRHGLGHGPLQQPGPVGDNCGRIARDAHELHQPARARRAAELRLGRGPEKPWRKPLLLVTHRHVMKPGPLSFFIIQQSLRGWDTTAVMILGGGGGALTQTRARYFEGDGPNPPILSLFIYITSLYTALLGSWGTLIWEYLGPNTPTLANS